MSPKGSAVPRRVLSRQLKQLREEAGVSPAVAAERIGIAPNTMWRLESGYPVRLYPPMIESLCELYNASDEVTQALLTLHEESKQSGWWYAYRGALREDFNLYLSLEEAAERLTIFQPTIIPGLLQTADYRRTLIRAAYPDVADNEIDRRVEVQMHRQDRLRAAKQLSLTVLLGEAALHNRVGGPDVMLQQLHHLDAIGELPNVSIRVVPFANPSPYGILTDSFIFMEFPQQRSTAISLTATPVVYVEGYTGALYADKEEEIRQYVDVIPKIKNAALSQDESRALVRDNTKEYAA